MFCIRKAESNLKNDYSLGNKLVDYSNVVGASPVDAAPTTSSFLTLHLVSMDGAKATARRDGNHLSYGIWWRKCLHQKGGVYSQKWLFFTSKCVFADHLKKSHIHNKLAILLSKFRLVAMNMYHGANFQMLVLTHLSCFSFVLNHQYQGLLDSYAQHDFWRNSVIAWYIKPLACCLGKLMDGLPGQGWCCPGTMIVSRLMLSVRQPQGMNAFIKMDAWMITTQLGPLSISRPL